jgi:apolipoprotein N-acyltransferase
MPAMDEAQPGGGPVPAPRGPHPAVSAVVSALLLWASFPPVDWGWLAWAALVPLFLLVQSRRAPLALYLGVWAGGMAFWTLAVQWIRLTDPSAWLAWLAMALALSIFWPLFLVLARLAVLRLGLPLMIAAPIVWVALEYVRAYYVSGFPWYYLAHSQYAVLPLIQVSDLTGSLGVSLLVALVNAWLVDLLTLPLLRPGLSEVRLTPPQARRLGTVVVLLVATLGYGAFRMATSRFRPGPRIALLQSNILPRHQSEKDSKKIPEIDYPAKILETYERLIGLALRSDETPDLIVWPETSYPYAHAWIDPALDAETLDRQARQIIATITGESWRSRSLTVSAHLAGWADRLGIPMLVGVNNYDHRPAGLSKFNSAVLVAPREPAPRFYHKVHLVPFGEYIPLIKTFPWLTVLTPYHGETIPSLNFGPGPSWFDLGPYRLSVAICFEDTVPQLIRRFFHEAPEGRHPDVLINMSNDGWFGASSEHEMHLFVSVFRAIEHRVPLARSANTGISAIVDGDGRILRRYRTAESGVIQGVVPLDDRTTLYTAWGDWLGRSCLAVTIGLVPLSLFWRGRRPARTAS